MGLSWSIVGVWLEYPWSMVGVAGRLEGVKSGNYTCLVAPREGASASLRKDSKDTKFKGHILLIVKTIYIHINKKYADKKLYSHASEFKINRY